MVRVRVRVRVSVQAGAIVWVGLGFHSESSCCSPIRSSVGTISSYANGCFFWSWSGVKSLVFQTYGLALGCARAMTRVWVRPQELEGPICWQCGDLPRGLS